MPPAAARRAGDVAAPAGVARAGRRARLPAARRAERARRCYRSRPAPLTRELPMYPRDVVQLRRRRRSRRALRLSTVPLEVRGGAALPVAGNRRQPALLERVLEAQPTAVESCRETGTTPLDHPAVLRPTAIGVLHRLHAHATLELAAFRQLRHDVPCLPFRALRIPEDAISHGDPPPLVASASSRRPRPLG